MVQGNEANLHGEAQGSLHKMPSKARLNRPKPLVDSNSLLDEINRALLRHLLSEPRLTMAELARRVKMSAPSVTERVRRLEDTGVIAGYQLRIDPKALGFPVAAYVRIRPEPRQLQRVAQLAAETPEVVECHRITGEDCFLMKVYVSAVDQLERVLDRFLPYGQTTTSIVQSSPVPIRPLPLPTT
jgi:Lrp/AsnC family leucine-responsive transcriptional regulator